MRIKRILLAASAAVLASFAFSSCVNEAPEINYVVEYTHNSDFSSIIEAIKSQSTTIAQKLDAVQAAVSEGFLTMEEASSALKDALVESLNTQNATLSDIQQAIVSQNLLLEDKLDVLTAAVNNQTATLQDALDYIDASIQDQTQTLEAKLELINETIETGAANLVEALEAFEETMDEDLQGLTQATNIQTIAIGMVGNAIVNAINNGVTTLEEALAAIEEAIDDQTTVLETQLAVIAQAIEQAASTVEDAIGEAALTIDDALDALGGVIEDAIEGGVDDITGALSDFADALVDSIGDNTDQLEAIVGKLEDLQADFAEYNEPLAGYIQDIIDAIYESHGVTPPTPPAPTPRYEVVDGVLCMNQLAYDEIMAADDPQAAIKAKLEENQITPTVPDIAAVSDDSMNSRTQTATVYHREAANPVYHTFFYDYDDPEDTDDKLVKKAVYCSIAFDFTVTGYNARIQGPGNRRHTLHWSLDAQNWSDPISSSSFNTQHGGTATYNVAGVSMINDDGTFASMIYFEYAE